MIFGKVLKNDKVYISPVFAIRCSLKNCKVIIFDETYSKLIVTDLYENHKNTIFYLKYDYSDFAIQEEKFKSYWNDKSIFSKVNKKDYSSKIIEEAKSFLNQNNIGEYYQIESEKDLEGLDINVGGFHDGYVLSMKQNDENTEILIDTTWGSVILLKCYNLVQNDLNIGDSFSWCDMEIDSDNNIKFIFESFDGRELILCSVKVAFKLFFEIRCKNYNLKYDISDTKITIFDYKKEYIINRNEISILDLNERNAIGFFDEDDGMIRCFICLKDYFLSYYNILYRKIENHSVKNKFNIFKEECEKNNFYFDSFPWVNYWGPSIDEQLGELIYKKEYSKRYKMLEMLKYVYVGPLIWNIILFIIKLFNKEMKWIGLLIMGLGITAVFTIIILFVIIKELLSKDSNFNSSLEIRERGIIYTGKTPSFSLTFDVITNIEFDKKITIITENCKYTLYRTKDDEKIYKLLKENFENYMLIRMSDEK